MTPSSLAQPRKRVGGEAAARVDGGGARLRLLDPGFGGRALGRRQLRKLGDRAGEIVPRRHPRGARDATRCSIAFGLADRAHAHQLLGVDLQPLQEVLARRGSGRTRRSPQRRRKLRELERERADTGHARGRERFERRELGGIGAKRLHRRELWRERLAALDRGLERVRREGETERAVTARRGGGADGRTFGELGFERLVAALKRGDALVEAVEIAAREGSAHLLPKRRDRRGGIVALRARVAGGSGSVVAAAAERADGIG